MGIDFHLMLWLASVMSGLLGAMMAQAAAPSAGSRRRPSDPAEAPPAHPRLFFGPQDLPRLARLSYVTPHYLDEQNFTIAEFDDTEIVFPLPPRAPGFIENPPGFGAQFGRYPYWTGIAKGIEARLQSLALSYASTRDPRYARRAIEYMLALAEWNIWMDRDYSERTCLDTCHLTMGVAFAYDVCWEAMSAAERERVRGALVRLGLAELAQDAPAHNEHSLQLLRNAALGLGALAIAPEQPQAWDYVQLAKGFFRWWLDLRQDSRDTEGLSYTAYGLDHCLLFGAALAQAEGDREVIEHPYVAQAVRWALYFWGPAESGLVNFCDAAITHPFEVTMRVAGKYLRDPYAGYYLQRTGRLQQGQPGPVERVEGTAALPVGQASRLAFTAAVLHDPEPPAAWPPPWSASACFANIGWAALRSGWGDDATLLAFISSSSQQGHCHRDANHFVVNCAGEWLAADSGYKSYKGGAATEFSQGTAGHNSVLIGGAGQTDKAGAISDFFTSPAFDYVAGDASRAYDPAVLWRFLRRIIHVRPHFFAILDELEAPQPKRFELLLHTDAEGRCEIEGKPARPGETVSAQRVSLVKPGARLEVRFLEPVAAQVSFGRAPGTGEDYPPFFTVRDARPRESQRFLSALVPVRQQAAPFTLELHKYAETSPERLVRLESYGALLFRGRGAGERLTLSLPVPVEGTYRLIGHFLRSPAQGDWQVRIDGREAGATYRGYAPDVRTRQAWDLGVMRLSRGRHEFSFALTGKHDLSSGYLVGVHDIELQPVAGTAVAPAPAPTRLQGLSGDGWVGIACNLADGHCRAYFRLTGADEIADRELRTDADAALLITPPRGEARVAAHRATRVELAGRQLLQASAPVNFALLPGETWSLTLEAEGRAEVVLYLRQQPRRPSIPPSLARGVRYDPTAPALRIRLRPGSHTITWSTV